MRPINSVSGAGYQSAAGQSFDPLNQSKYTHAVLAKKQKNKPEENAKQLEKKVHVAIEESSKCTCMVQGEFSKALDLAKDAGRVN